MGLLRAFILLALLVLFVHYLDSILDYISNLMGVNIKNYINDEFNSFNLESVVSGRTEQSVISNTSNPLSFIFGEGFGKDSPNNFLTIRKMPDASYYRIFDELGVVGFILFFLPYIEMVRIAVKKKRIFTIYFFIETFAAFFFNRILWMIPLNFIIYSLIGISTAEESCFFANECTIKRTA